MVNDRQVGKEDWGKHEGHLIRDSARDDLFFLETRSGSVSLRDGI